MNKTTLILAALLAGASLTAQTTAPVASATPAAAPAPVVTPAASSYSITMDFPYTTKYVFRGVELAQASIQPSIKLTTGNAYIGVWTNQPATSNIDNEFDFFGGYNFKLAESWSLDVGLTWYYYPELDSSTGLDRSTYEGYVGLNGTVGSFTTGTYAFYDMTLKNFTLQEALGYAITISPKSSLNFTATLGYVSPDVGDSYTYWGLGATLPYKLTDSATLSAGLQYADHNISGVSGNHFWGTLDLSVSF
jgi:uncharacterized protein (TIGR02001 family)